MNRRMLLTLSTAAFLCGMCEAYALLVGPLFAPRGDVVDKNRTDPTLVPPKPPENRRQAEKHLGVESWACDSKYQFRTEGGFFYFQEWDKIDESGDIRFEPFAMIWRPKGHDPQKDPYTIVSDSALLKFAEKFEITNRNPGRVVGGALEGKVTIRGPDGLLIDGQNFNFAEAALRIWSDHAVKFRQGPHSGRGQGLELKLIPSVEPVSSDKPAVSGISSVRLLKDVEMQLVSESKTSDKSSDKSGETVFVDSQGSFEFDVVAHVATFQKVVRVKRPTGKGQSDRLACDELTLVFEPEEVLTAENTTVASETPPAPEEGLGRVGGNLNFRRLRAEGAVVTVVSDRSEMQGKMNELTYDAQARVIALRDAKQVKLVQRNNDLYCPEVTAVLDEDGEIDRVICRGAGKLFSFPRGKPSGRSRPEKRTPLLAAEWKKQLQKSPDPKSELDLIEFEGRAVLNQAGKMSLQGEIVRIWVTPQARKPGGTSREKGSSFPDDDQEDAQPKRMLAFRDVAFASPKISGRTDRLEIWFEEGTLPTPPMAQEARTLPHRVLRHDAAAPSNRLAATSATAAGARVTVRSNAPVRALQSVRNRKSDVDRRSRRGQAFAAVDDDDANTRATPKTTPAAAENPPQNGAARSPENSLSVTADLIRVRALREGGDTQIAEVITEGHVRVVQEHKSGDTPLDLTGERLHLWNYSEFNQVVDVSGRPAQVQDRGMQIEGPEIHFDRGQNLANVAGAGVLRLPMKKDLQGNPLSSSQMLDVFWQEKMEFDGEAAKFYDKVRAQLGSSEMKCEEMEVTFASRISFSDDASNAQQTEVKFLVCRDGVDFKSSEYQKTRLTGVRTAKAFELAINRQNGRVTAQGPGTLVDWRRGNGKRAGVEPSAGVRANGALAAESVEWEYTRIDFAGRMDGNSDDRIATFYDRVRVVYGPVAHSTDSIDEDSLPKDGGWMHCNRLQLTQHPESKKQRAYIEMEATGNTELEGRTFHAMAHVVTYDESKGLYVLTGDGKQHAKIWQQKMPGAEPMPFAGQRMKFIPSENSLQIDGAIGGQGSR